MAVEKKEGAMMECGTCGKELICEKFIFQDQPELSWCDKGTKNKHFKFDKTKNKSFCKFEGLIDITLIDDLIDVLDNIEKRVKEKLSTDNDYKVGMYTKMIFMKLKQGN